MATGTEETQMSFSDAQRRYENALPEDAPDPRRCYEGCPGMAYLDPDETRCACEVYVCDRCGAQELVECGYHARLSAEDEHPR